jgi:hypothetical protein
MPYKDKSFQRQCQSAWYQSHKQLCLERQKKRRADNPNSRKEEAKRYREQIKLKKLTEDNSAWYQNVCADIRKGNQPFSKLTEQETELWWRILNQKLNLPERFV